MNWDGNDYPEWTLATFGRLSRTSSEGRVRTPSRSLSPGTAMVLARIRAG